MEELALGRNLKVHLCHGKGITFEDAIVISEKVVQTIFSHPSR
jgi:DNA-directed RNA polymerase beta subunit